MTPENRKRIEDFFDEALEVEVVGSGMTIMDYDAASSARDFKGKATRIFPRW